MEGGCLIFSEELLGVRLVDQVVIAIRLAKLQNLRWGGGGGGRNGGEYIEEREQGQKCEDHVRTGSSVCSRDRERERAQTNKCGDTRERERRA